MLEENSPLPSLHTLGERDPSHVKVDRWGEVQFQGMWLTCKLSPVKQVTSFWKHRGLHYLSSCFNSAVLLSCSSWERFRAVLGHRGCSAAGSIVAAAGPALTKPRSVAALSCADWLLSLDPYPVGWACCVGQHCPWTICSVVGNHPCREQLAPDLTTALFPLPCAKCSSRAQQPMKTFNFGHCWDSERLKWAGAAGATVPLGLLCSHTKHSIRPLFSILKHRKTCTYLRSDSAC